MAHHLLITNGSEKGKTFPLTDNTTFTIGRSDSSDIQLSDASVSRTHCRIHVNEMQTRLEDAGSSGGTFVAGQKVTDIHIPSGTEFRIGDTQFRYQGIVDPLAETMVSPETVHIAKMMMLQTWNGGLAGQASEKNFCAELAQTECAQILICKIAGIMNGDEKNYEFLEGFREHLSDKAHLVFDLEHLTHLNSSGVGVFVACITAAKENDCKMFLVNQPDNIRGLLNLVGVSTLVQIHETTEDAMREIHGND
ncbi:MAG: FHA domain-containing protein [Pirellulaceae bacterium]|nr:FHA domain-containing protein [Pirellulaceae bacterium]